MMNSDDKKEIKELIQNIGGVGQIKNEGQFDLINLKLDGINNHLIKLNGKVAKHEETLNTTIIEKELNKEHQKQELLNHVITCPIKPIVDSLEKETMTTKALKKFQSRLFIISTTILGLLITLIGIWLKLG